MLSIRICGAVVVFLVLREAWNFSTLGPEAMKLIPHPMTEASSSDIVWLMSSVLFFGLTLLVSLQMIVKGAALSKQSFLLGLVYAGLWIINTDSTTSLDALLDAPFWFWAACSAPLLIAWESGQLARIETTRETAQQP